MKKAVKSAITFLLTIAFLLIVLYFNQKDGILNNEQILEIVKPKINDYCGLLANNASISTCATCNFDTYELVEDFSVSSKNRITEYTIEKQEYGYLVNVQPYIIYGSNTRMGRLIVSFTLDKEGKVIEESYPERTCLQ